MESRTATALAEVLERLRDAPDRREGLRLLAEALASVLRCDRVTVWTQGGLRRPHALRATFPGGQIAAGTERPTLDLEGERCANELRKGRCVILCDVELRERLTSVLEVRPGDDVLLFLLQRGGRSEGLVICSRRDAFTDDQLTTCEQIAPHVALAARSWRLEDVQAHVRERRNRFAALTADVLKADDLESTAVRLCELTLALFNSTRSALFLLEDQDLVPIAAAGPYGDRAAGGSLHVPPGVEPIFDEALVTKQVIVVNEFRASRYAATPIPLPFRPQAALVIPLVDTSGTLGVLTASELDEPHHFDQNAAEDARLLGATGTIAMRRVLLVDELRNAARTKDEFLAAVSHELRTPLNVVLGYLQLLSERAFGPLTDEQEDTLRRVEKGARSQLALVNDLLDLAEIERGSLHCEFTSVRIAELEPELLDVVRPMLAGRPISYSSDLPGGLVAHSDRERLKQVLVNLLANSAKYTERGEIRLHAHAGDGSVVIVVSDTGTGMEPGFVRRATEPFVRGEGQRSGSGLGLAIVSRVLRALGGELTIDSQPGTGTTIHVALPAALPLELERPATT